MDEGKLVEEASRGARAKAILEAEIYRESMKSVRSAIIEKWESCPIRDQEGQHELKIMLKLLKEVEAHLKTVMETGKMASIQLENERTLKAKARRLFRAA